MQNQELAGIEKIRPDCEKKTDEELAKLSLENQAYFLCIINRYKSKLMAYVKRISGSTEEDAEDILQEVFIKVYQNLNDFDSGLKFSSWIYRITHNAVISNFRKTKARPNEIQLDLGDDRIKILADDFDIEKELNIDYLRRKIFKALNNLDSKHKEIIVLKFFEEKSYKEISDIIKKPMGTVASKMNKAKSDFKKEYEKLN